MAKLTVGALNRKLSAPTPRTVQREQSRVQNTILLTGFEPFGGESSNPSWEAVRTFANTQLTHAGVHYAVHAVQLPCVFQSASALLRGHLKNLRPTLCLCVGQAGGRAMISLEKFAINFAHAAIADNAGAQPRFQKLQENGPLARTPNFDFAAALRALSDANIPAELSLSAGSFVCNDVFYTLCRQQPRHPQLRGSFVHIPFAPQQTLNKPGEPSMAQAQVVEALDAIMRSQLGAAAFIAGRQT